MSWARVSGEHLGSRRGNTCQTCEIRTDDSFSLNLMNVYDAIPLFVDGETEKFDCAGTRIQGVIAVRDSGSVGKNPGIFQIVGNFADKWITKDRIKTIRSISLSANFLIIWDIVKL